MNGSAAPLEGVRVLDFTAAMLGPSATQLLGDYGADVIKVERAGGGDHMRTTVPDPAGLDNPLFLSLNRNKRSITLNLKSETAFDIVRSLVEKSDVIVSNFRSGVMERLGLGYDDVKKINPRIIWASGTPFGPTGPLSHKAGIDQLAQGMTGLMQKRQSDDIPVSINPAMVADYVGSMHLAMGVLLALLARDKTGEGQRVDVSLYDSSLAVQIMEATDWLVRDRERNFARMPLNGVYPTTDGHVLMMGVFHSNALQSISTALEFDEDLSQRPEFATQDRQFANMDELQRMFRERFATNTTEYWLERLEAVDIMCSKLLSLGESLAHEQTAANDMVIEIEHPVVGRYRTLASPIHLSDSPMTVRHPAPRLGEHIDEVMRELGYEESDIERLRSERVFT